MTSTHANPRRTTMLAFGLAVSMGGGACGPMSSASRPSDVPERTPPPAKRDVVSERRGAPLRGKPGIFAHVSGPRSAPFQQSAAGVGGVHASIRLTNTTGQPVDVRDLTVQFASTREGVSFPCVEHAGGQMRPREPALLRPNESFVFERDIDCGTTLVGRYEVSASVGWGGSAVEFAGAFPLEVVGGPGAPRPYPGRPALHVALVGDTVIKAMPLSAWREGAYAPSAVLTNASPSPILLGAVRIVLVMKSKGGGPVPCEGESGSKVASLDTWKDAPQRLEPGVSKMVSVPIRCLPKGDGDYQIEGFLVLGDGPVEQGVPIGPLPLKITQDPGFTAPQLRSPETPDDERRRLIR